jgi:hypothetical protein
MVKEAAETVVEVRVMRLYIHLAKVLFPGGYHLVVGGRLVSSVKDGVKTAHPDLPAYEMSDFPVPYIPWADGEHPDIHVEVLGKNGKMREASVVRAGTVLFATCAADEVRAWIQRGGK